MSLTRVTTFLRNPLATLCLAALGLFACSVLVRHAGVDLVVDALLRVSAWLPLIMALELGRAAFELLSTRAVLGRLAAQVPLAVMLRAHFAAHAVSTLMPLGRSVGELSKAALLAPYVGAARAAAVGASGQTIALFVNGGIGIAGGALALAWGSPTPVALVFLGFGALLAIIAYALAFGARSPSLHRLLSRVYEKPALASDFAEMLRDKAALGPRAFAAQTGHRLCQALQLGIIAHALGAPSGMLAAPLLEVIYVAGASVGDLLPAQLGAVEGAFALTAPLIGLDAATAIALGLTLHAIQLAGAALAALLAAVTTRFEAPPFDDRSNRWEIRSEQH